MNWIRSSFHRLPPVRRLHDAIAELERDRQLLIGQRDALVAERDELAGHCERLSREQADSLGRERELRCEREELFRQRDALVAERDEAFGHAVRLDRALSEAHGREQALKALVGEVQAERDELHTRLVHSEAQLSRLQQALFTPPGHFYSPIADRDDPHVAAKREAFASRFEEGLELPTIDEPAMLDLLRRIAGHYSGFAFPEAKTEGWRYYFENPAFSYADAITLFGMLAEFRPARIVEVGCGFSSCAIMDTCDHVLGGSARLTCIDPYPEQLLALLPEADRYRSSIRALPVQSVAAEVFQELERNDLLFIDGSHVLKTGSDVNDYLFRILPGLRPGVLIHIHDVFYPFEYGPDWIAENRSWNEAYALRAFLAYNGAFEILFFNDLVYNKYAEETERQLPLCRKNTGGSLWLRKLD